MSLSMQTAIKRKILIVDDSKPLRQGLALMLSDEYQIASAASGEEALDLVDRFHPDALLLDLRLPGVGGEEVLRRLSSDHPNIRVIVISALGGSELWRRLYRMGARDYVLKPFSVNDLRLRLEDAFRD
jgi:DNA-binding response OmpR family regulator